MILFRHADPRFPFLWESALQPAARWHTEDEGPVQYLADTPDGAWAEFLRHEGIVDEEDLLGIERDLWAIEAPVEEETLDRPDLPPGVLMGGLATYPACQAEARRIRRANRTGLIASSAALISGGAHGWRVEEGRVLSGDPRDGSVIVLFGARPGLVGWGACARGRPGPQLLQVVRALQV